MDYVKDRCFGCGMPLDQYRMGAYCNYRCVPQSKVLKFPEELWEANRARVDRRVKLTDDELYMMQSYLGGNTIPPGGRLRLPKRVPLNLHRPTDRVDSMAYTSECNYIELTAEDIVENLMVIAADRQVELMRQRRSMPRGYDERFNWVGY